MVLTNEQRTTKALTQSLQHADRSLQTKIMGSQWTPSSKELVTLEKVNAKVKGLSFDDLKNIVEPILIDKIFKTELTTFLANNPWNIHYNSTQEYGKTKEHIINLAGTIVNLVGETAGDFGSYEMNAWFKENDINPSTLDFFNSKTIVYYTKHIRAFVETASFNFTELKGAFNSQGAWDSFTSSKTQMLMEQATQEESSVISNMVASLLIPRNILFETQDTTFGYDSDDLDSLTLITKPKLTLMGDDYKQADFVKYLQRFTNNVKFPQLAVRENPLGLPLITKSENLIAYVTPDIIASQNFLEAYAFTANKVTLPETTEMFAPLPPVEVKDLPVDTLGTIHGIVDGKYTGKVLPIALIGDMQAIDVVHSQLYTDSEVNKLREFMSAQVHDHMHVHMSYEKNIRFFAIPVIDEALVLPTLDKFNIVEPTTDDSTDGALTPPDTLLDTYGNTVKVTSALYDSTGKKITKANYNKLSKGIYNVVFSANNYEDVSMNIELKNQNILLTDIKFDFPSTIEMKVGDTYNLYDHVIYTPTNATNKKLEFNDKHDTGQTNLTIDSEGHLKALATTGNITDSFFATSTDGTELLANQNYKISD